VHTDSAISLANILPPTTREFTGHESVQGMDIIHMNGRIYDLTLGRFLQADPHIQAPKNSQNYNRYSYVLNNPLSYTDPTGYFFKKLLKLSMKITGDWYVHKLLNKVPWLKSIVSMALNFIPGCQVWCTAVFNAQSTFVATGSLNAALKSGAISYATGSAFSEIGAHFNGLDGSGSINFGGNMLTAGQVAQQILLVVLVLSCKVVNLGMVSLVLV